MQHDGILLKERAYLARVQSLLMAVIEQSAGQASNHDQAVRDILREAWDELRMRPTALSPKDLEQLNAELDRYAIRKSFTLSMADRYQKMLYSPYFARIDFRYDDEEYDEPIVIGMYSLIDPTGALLVHDWRAPVCALFYDHDLGRAEYEGPAGTIQGELLLKRQYRIENGHLLYYVDTSQSIDDGMLLDLLSSNSSATMRQVVSTIQSEQNQAIRYENVPALFVSGGAGSGKTAVAMHRAAYLLYRHRNHLHSGIMQILSPSDAFSQYISQVLPELGEDNVPTATLYACLRGVLKRARVEPPALWYERMLSASQARQKNTEYIWTSAYVRLLSQFAQEFKARGPEFEDLSFDGSLLFTKAQLVQLYQRDFKALSPALRLSRIRTMVRKKLEDISRSLVTQYERLLAGDYSGSELAYASKQAVSKKLLPLKEQIGQVLEFTPARLYRAAMEKAPASMRLSAEKQMATGRMRWEDAPGAAWLYVYLGFAKPNREVRHVVVDEVQDYPPMAIRCLSVLYPSATFTMLGDPNQNIENIAPRDASLWPDAAGLPGAPVVYLEHGYRSSQAITQALNGLLPEGSRLPGAFGREGTPPTVSGIDIAALKEQIAAWRKAGYGRIAAITRSYGQARALAPLLPGTLLVEEDSDLPLQSASMVLSSHLAKGLEFDAVAVVWENAPFTPSERRRLYVAGSRALHDVKFYLPDSMKEETASLLGVAAKD